ncbi:hypothetical protein JHK87_042483 [Glycine soja]|nr:hypothetical protein JHK87_042483 [Glycine soja]
MEKVKKEEEIKGSRKKISNEEIETKGDTVSKRVIREFIVSSGGESHGGFVITQDFRMDDHLEEPHEPFLTPRGATIYASCRQDIQRELTSTSAPNNN